MTQSGNAIQRIGFVVNTQKPAALTVAREALRLLEGRIEAIALSHEVAHLLDEPQYACDDMDVLSSEAVLVFGGDGTVLATSRMCAPLGTPMLGINLGRFGFLNDVAPEAVPAALDRLLAGNFEIEERLMLCGAIMREGQAIHSACALNEIVISHGSFLRVLQISMSINGKYVTTYAADGLITATPTGSTAYSLSAGGPLVYPSLETLLVTPICAHTLTTRALLVPNDHIITIEVENAEEDGVKVTLDGQQVLPIEVGDSIRISRAPYRARLISPHDGIGFYDKLQTKLRWGERLAY